MPFCEIFRPRQIPSPLSFLAAIPIIDINHNHNHLHQHQLPQKRLLSPIMRLNRLNSTVS